MRATPINDENLAWRIFISKARHSRGTCTSVDTRVSAPDIKAKHKQTKQYFAKRNPKHFRSRCAYFLLSTSNELSTPIRRGPIHRVEVNTNYRTGICIEDNVYIDTPVRGTQATTKTVRTARPNRPAWQGPTQAEGRYIRCRRNTMVSPPCFGSFVFAQYS